MCVSGSARRPTASPKLWTSRRGYYARNEAEASFWTSVVRSPFRQCELTPSSGTSNTQHRRIHRFSARVYRMSLERAETRERAVQSPDRPGSLEFLPLPSYRARQRLFEARSQDDERELETRAGGTFRELRQRPWANDPIHDDVVPAFRVADHGVDHHVETA